MVRSFGRDMQLCHVHIRRPLPHFYLEQCYHGSEGHLALTIATFSPRLQFNGAAIWTTMTALASGNVACDYTAHNLLGRQSEVTDAFKKCFNHSVVVCGGTSRAASESLV